MKREYRVVRRHTPNGIWYFIQVLDGVWVDTRFSSDTLQNAIIKCDYLLNTGDTPEIGSEEVVYP